MKSYNVKKSKFITLLTFIIILFIVFAFSELSKSIDSDSSLLVHFIDVGQADSILVQCGNDSLLIDAGSNSSSETVVNYIKDKGIKKLDYLILTHPHEDHIGGADAVIDSYDIKKIYMPRIATNTKSFEDMSIAMVKKRMKAINPVPGTNFTLGNATCTILAPNGERYDNINNYSIVLKLSYENTSFLFTGDAESLSENEILNAGYNIKSDVLKVGHHGSDSSTTNNFFKAVSPKYAVICVEKDNSYGHPHQPVLSRLISSETEIYRTDQCGTIVAESDGNNITFHTERENINDLNNLIVYYTDNGKAYHFDENCSTLSQTKNIRQGKIKTVIQLGKGNPCSRCTE